MVYYFHFISVGGAWGVGLMVIMGLNSCNWHHCVPSLESNPLSFWGLLPSPGLCPPTTRFSHKSWSAGPLASLLAPNHPSPTILMSHHHPQSLVFLMTYLCFRITITPQLLLTQDLPAWPQGALPLGLTPFLPCFRPIQLLSVKHICLVR